MAKTEQLLGIIKGFVSYIEKLSEDDIEKINSKEATIKFEVVKSIDTNRLKFQKSHFKNNPAESIDIDLIIRNLNEFTNRQESENFLFKRCSTRTQLEGIAKKLDIPFQKKDNLEHLRNKIIEGTIGYKLRSQAIQTISNR